MREAPIEAADEAALEAIICLIGTAAVIGAIDESKADRPAHRIPRKLQERGIRVVPVFLPAIPCECEAT